MVLVNSYFLQQDPYWFLADPYPAVWFSEDRYPAWFCSVRIRTQALRKTPYAKKDYIFFSVCPSVFILKFEPACVCVQGAWGAGLHNSHGAAGGPDTRLCHSLHGGEEQICKPVVWIWFRRSQKCFTVSGSYITRMPYLLIRHTW